MNHIEKILHRKRKHTAYSEINRPSKCDICDENFVNYRGEPRSIEWIEEHRLSHSYRRSDNLQYKCDECTFWGKNELSMIVHVKKYHAEKITCGLCDYVAVDSESLETHQFTCEIHKCSDCHNKFTNLNALKNHVKDDHAGKQLRITHTKQDRTDPDNYQSNDYKSRDLLNKQN